MKSKQFADASDRICKGGKYLPGTREKRKAAFRRNPCDMLSDRPQEAGAGPSHCCVACPWLLSSETE